MAINVEINGEKINSPQEFHRVLAEKLDFGPYYHPNLAALWDRLSTDVERPVALTWRNAENSRDAMGAAAFDDLRNLLLRVERQDEDFGREDRFTVRFAQEPTPAAAERNRWVSPSPAAPA
ncbi:barstar family protein [Streptomyces sp. NPDC005435]|uniref:barstar family protein n=1 Tax=Streptomyces sp. NPDC005435 TaxID=3154464 RepID=UPI003455085B